MYCAADISVCRLLVLRWVLFMQVPMLLQYVPYKVDVAVDEVTVGAVAVSTTVVILMCVPVLCCECFCRWCGVPLWAPIPAVGPYCSNTRSRKKTAPDWPAPKQPSQ